MNATTTTTQLHETKQKSRNKTKVNEIENVFFLFLPVSWSRLPSGAARSIPRWCER